MKIKRVVKTPTLRKNTIGVLKRGVGKVLKTQNAENGFNIAPMPLATIADVKTLAIANGMLINNRTASKYACYLNNSTQSQYIDEIDTSDNTLVWAKQSNMVLVVLTWRRNRSRCRSLGEFIKYVKTVCKDELVTEREEYDPGLFRVTPIIDSNGYHDDNGNWVWSRCRMFARLNIDDAIQLAKNNPDYLDGYIVRWRVKGITMSANPSQCAYCLPFDSLRAEHVDTVQTPIAYPDTTPKQTLAEYLASH